MEPKQSNYLENFEPATGYETMLDGLRQEMEDAVPEITDRIRQREELAAELRISSSRPSQSRKKIQD